MICLTDLIERLLKSDNLSSPAQYLKKYESPLDVTLDRGKEIYEVTQSIIRFRLTSYFLNSARSVVNISSLQF